SPEDHIAVVRIIFDQSGKPPRLLRGDHGRPGTAERIEDDGAASAAVPDGVGHEVDWLDRRVPFEVVETPFPESIDARILPHVGPVSTSLAEAKRIHMLCGPDLEHENQLVLRPIERAHAAVGLVPYAKVLQFGKDLFAGV